MSEKETWFERNVHWLYFMAGMVLVQSRISFIDDFVALWGEWRAFACIPIGLGFAIGTKSIGFLLDKIINIRRREKNE